MAVSMSFSKSLASLRLRPDPGRVWHRILDAAEAVLWLGLLIAGGAVGYTILRTDAPSSSDAQIAPLPPGLVEAEALQILGRSREFTFWLQPTDGFRGGRWSGDGHMLALGTQHGDWIDLGFPPTDRGPHRLELFLTRAMDYGIVAAFVNGEQVGEEVDLWSDVGVVPTGEYKPHTPNRSGNKRSRSPHHAAPPRSRRSLVSFPCERSATPGRSCC